MGIKGKFDLLQKLPCTKAKIRHAPVVFPKPTSQADDSIPPPPPPPPPPPYSSNDQKQQPSYNYASMDHCPPAWGVLAKDAPEAVISGSLQTTDGFNVWCFKGYSGRVNFPKNADPIETLGRLETMNQVMHNRHDYNPLKLGAIPRPPTPSKEDKKKDAEAKKECTSTVDHAKANLECKICHCNEKSQVREIKRIENIPLCWPCVWKNFHADADLAWNGN